ncbi:MAG: leucyl aminopeptidase [Rhodothermales bacterium]|jgi:leucyl aminopeptidase
MKVSVTTISISELDVDLLLIPMLQEQADGTLADLASGFGGSVRRAAPDFSGETDSSVLLYPETGSARRIALLGLGAQDKLDGEALRMAAAEGARLAAKAKVETVGIALSAWESLDVESVAQAVVEGFLLGSYRFDRYKTDAEPATVAARLVLQTSESDKAVRRGAERGRVISEAVCAARDLVNTSPNDKTPTLFAKAMEKSAKKYGYLASVWDQELIEEEQMGGLLAVNLGSQEPPTFTVLEWMPDNRRNERPVVLVGKGVVFDTGGLSLKPTKDSMDAMKSDMAGAAAVIGAVEAIARMELPLYVIGLIPATDNRPGENAYVPGDVIKMHSGMTVEVLNTDAEGRMILADALSYAKTYNPEVVIDLATLTGAAVVALGNLAAAVMTSEGPGAAELIAPLVDAGVRTGERVHELPMYAGYGEDIKSDVADIKNVGGRGAGAITAAKFLEHFVSYPWIHMDIAGPSYLKTAKPYRTVGGTGFGVRILVEYLRDYADRKRG